MADQRREIAHHIGGGRFHIARFSVQKLVQAGGDAGEVDRSDEDLQGGKAQRRQCETPVADLHFAAHEGGKRQIAGSESKASHAERDGGGGSKPGDLSRGAGKQDEAEPGQRDQSKPHGHAAKEDQLGYLLRIEAPAGIETIAHRTAAEGRDAHIVTDGKAGEGGKRGARIGERLADIVQGQKVEDREAEIGAGREGECQGEIPLGNSGDGVADIVPGILRQRPVEQPTRDEHRKGDERVEDMGTFHAAGPSRSVGPVCRGGTKTGLLCSRDGRHDERKAWAGG